MNYRKVLLLILTTAFLTGCWDNMEIQERGYILSIAIDKASPLPKGFEPNDKYKSERDLEKMPLQKGEPKYAYTFQLPVIAKAKNQPSGAGGSGGEGKALWNVTVRGNSFMEASKELNTMLDYPPFYEHLQVIVISEEVAREGISVVLDSFLRDYEMRRRTWVYITSEEAKKLLDVVTPITDYSGMYLSTLPFNSEQTSKILHKTDLGKVSEALHQKMDFVLPKVMATAEQIKGGCSAVFKGEELVGWLGEIDTMYLKWIRNTAKGDTIVIEQNKALVALATRNIKVKVRPIIEGSRIKMHIEVKALFDQVERLETYFTDSWDEQIIRDMEKITEAQIKSNIEDTIQYVQKEFGADVFYFDKVMMRYEPKVWDQVRDRWHDIFPQIKTEVEVKVKIRQVGTMK